MQMVKILPKGQITLPKKIRESLGVHEGDSLIIEKTGGEIILKKGKTIHDFMGSLPNLGMTIDEIREKAVKEGAKDRA